METRTTGAMGNQSEREEGRGMMTDKKPLFLNPIYSSKKIKEHFLFYWFPAGYTPPFLFP
jgi:hypothetical protein